MRVRSALWLFTAALPLAGQIDPQSQTSIEGQVVSFATGVPLANAAVTLHHAGSQPSANEVTLRTNDEGKFRFANVVPGLKWELWADRRGYVEAKYGARRFSPEGTQIYLDRDQQIKGLVLQMVPESVISGRVVDGNSEPIEGAHITVLKSVGAAGSRRWSEVAFAVTLDNGEYRVPRIRSGRYLVRCSVDRPERTPSESGVELGFATTYYPNATDPSQAAELDVREGAEMAGINMRLTTGPMFHVRGSFRPASARPAPGWVALVDKADPTKVLISAGPAPPDYQINLNRIPPGSYFAVGRWVNETANMYVAIQEILVKDHDVENLLLAPALRGPIVGSMKLQPADRQVDLRNVNVEIRPIQLAGGMNSSVYRPRILLGPDLQFRQQVPWGIDFVQLTIAVSNLPDGCYLKSIQYGGRDVPDSGIDYSNDATVEATIGTDGGRVDGKSLNKDDQPLAGAVVALIPSATNERVLSVLSGADGTFHFTSVGPGDYQVMAWDDVSRDDLENPDFVKQYGAQAAEVKLEPNGSAAASVRVSAVGVK